MNNTSLAKDLWDRSKWFFRAKDEDAPPRRREIAERLRDLSEYVGNLATDDDGRIQHWDRVERLITPPLRPSRAFFFDVLRVGSGRRLGHLRRGPRNVH